MTERCTRCHEPIDADATAMGWPIQHGADVVGPCCYGDEAYCPHGHVLPATTDSDECQACHAVADQRLVAVLDEGGVTRRCGLCPPGRDVVIADLDEALIGAPDAMAACEDAILAARAMHD